MICFLINICILNFVKNKINHLNRIRNTLVIKFYIYMDGLEALPLPRGELEMMPPCVLEEREGARQTQIKILFFDGYNKPVFHSKSTIT